MAEQPHPWGERTLEVTPQDPWADPPQHTRSIAPDELPADPSTAATPTAATPTAAGPAAGPAHPPGPSYAFSRGVAHVKPAMPRTEPFTAAHEPTGTGWPGAEPPRVRQPLGAQLRLLRRGGGWTSAAVLFAFVCWGIWTLSSDGDGLTTPLLVLTVTLLVALGLFALSRLVGRIVLERQFHRVRRTATGSHLVVAVFLVGAGLAFLQQVSWVVQAWGWVTSVL